MHPTLSPNGHATSSSCTYSVYIVGLILKLFLQRLGMPCSAPANSNSSSATIRPVLPSNRLFTSHLEEDRCKRLDQPYRGKHETCGFVSAPSRSRTRPLRQTNVICTQSNVDGPFVSPSPLFPGPNHKIQPYFRGIRVGERIQNKRNKSSIERNHVTGSERSVIEMK